MFRTGRLSSNTQIVRGVVDRVSAAARVVGGGGRRLSSDHARGCCTVQCARNLRSTPKQGGTPCPNQPRVVGRGLVRWRRRRQCPKRDPLCSGTWGSTSVRA